jgi:DNA replication and repair protein RecF
VEPGYLDAWKSYRRVLSQRNAALKRSAASPELRPWSVALAEAGAVVDTSRRRYLERLGPFVAEFGRRLLDRPLSLEYRRGWDGEQRLDELLAAAEPNDRQNGSTQAGPHRAEIVLRLDGRRVQDEASRGQQKLTAAAMILSQVAVESADRPQRSMLLVDDPAAELDARSLERLMAAIDDLPAQLVLTALTPEHLVPHAGFPTFHVERGEVRTL